MPVSGAMKLLFDDTVRRRRALHFPESFTLHTVQEIGRTGADNGPPLYRAAGNDSAAVITVDRGIEHRQNADALPIPFAIAARNRLQDLQRLAPGGPHKRFRCVPA